MVSGTSATATAVALGSGIASLCRPTQVSGSETDCCPVGGHGGTVSVLTNIRKPELGAFLYPILFHVTVQYVFTYFPLFILHWVKKHQSL